MASLLSFRVEKLWEKWSLFGNFTDIRQAKSGNIYTGNASNAVFRDIYAPLDDFAVNGGLKVSL